MSSAVTTLRNNAQRVDSFRVAALLATLGFPLCRDCLARLSGDGVSGQPVFWRFSDFHPRLKMRAVTRDALNPWEHSGVQRLIAVAYANLQALADHRIHGVALVPQPLGNYTLLRSAAAVPLSRSAQEVAAFSAAANERTAEVAAMCTLGHLPLPGAVPDAVEVQDAVSLHRWYLPASAAAPLARFRDKASCGTDAAQDDVAWLCVAFDNLAFFRTMAQRARAWVRVANGDRSVMLPADASEDQIARADHFLYA